MGWEYNRKYSTACDLTLGNKNGQVHGRTNKDREQGENHVSYKSSKSYVQRRMIDEWPSLGDLASIFFIFLLIKSIKWQCPFISIHENKLFKNKKIEMIDMRQQTHQTKFYEYFYVLPYASCVPFVSWLRYLCW